MLVLSLDTATLVSSVAIASEDRLLAELTTQTRLTHSETLMPHIKDVLELASVTKEKIDGVAVSIGPGSFTGLRIGLATAKAICYALNVPIIAVPTLEAMAARFPFSGAEIYSLMDAQKGNVYRAVYSWQNGAPLCIREIEVMPFEAVLDECAADNTPIIMTGDIVQRKTAKLILPENVTVAPPTMVMPRAAETAFLGIKKLAEGKVDNLMDLEPLYVRRSEAEVLWEMRQKKAAEK